MEQHVDALLANETAGEGGGRRTDERAAWGPGGAATPDHLVRFDAIGLQAKPDRVAVGDDQVENAPPASPQPHLDHQRGPISQWQAVVVVAGGAGRYVTG